MMKAILQASILGGVIVALASCSSPEEEETTQSAAASASGDAATAPAAPEAPAAATALPNGVPVAANGVPLVRTGLWESEVEGSGGVKMHFCRLSPSSQNDAWSPLSLTAAQGCERTRSIVEDTLRVITRCDAGPNARNETEMTFKGSETEYETALTMTSIRSGETHAVPPTVLRERWVGDCPADMKDGDRKVVTG